MSSTSNLMLTSPSIKQRGNSPFKAILTREESKREKDFRPSMARIVFATTTTVPNIEELMERNAELEREVSKGKQREERMMEELERTRARLRMVEEAEERLCSELGDLEAEAIAHARAYLLRIKYLAGQLALARKILSS